MSHLLTAPSIPAPVARHRPPKPTWEIALLFPGQGDWSDEEYLLLPTNRLVELSDRRLEVLPMPSTLHQRILLLLIRELLAFVEPRKLGEALMAALPVRLWAGKFREPDVVFMLAKHRSRIQAEYWEGADLVMEVVSPHDPQRDLLRKRREYAQAGIPEYWIVDPQHGKIAVLRLQGKKYVVHGEYRSGQQAESALLPGFRVEVAKVFASR
jgi:Uma2 family endonuclease